MSSKAAQYQYETKEQHVHDRKTHLCYEIPSLLGDQNKGKNETISKKRIPTYPPESFRECGECGEGEGERRGDYFFEDRSRVLSIIENFGRFHNILEKHHKQA